MAKIKAGKAVVDALRAEGVECVFGIVGWTVNAIATELYGLDDIRFIDTRHEEGSAFMAYGYARASGKPAVCLTTNGGGAMNLLTGMSLAYKGRAPVLAIAGNVHQKHLGRDGHQEFDLVNMFKPVTCLSREINQTGRIVEHIHEAFRAAMSGKRGPVFLSIPADLLSGHVEADELTTPRRYRSVQQHLRGDTESIKQAASLLVQARRPVLLAGGGVIDSDACGEAVALAEALDMALVPSYGHNDAVPNSHPLYIGVTGKRGSGEVLKAIHQADVILALGCRLSQDTTGWDYSFMNPETRIIQVDIDPHEVGRNYPIEVGVVGDAKAVAEQLLEALRMLVPQGRRNAEWRAEIQALGEGRRARLAKEATLSGDPMMPQQVYPELRKVLPKDCMVSLDAGVASGLAYERLDFDLPRTFFNYSGQGGLGMGFCVGLGTKVGRPDRTAISIQGDGGFLYTSQELNTAVRKKIPLVSIVLNNNCHGAEKAQQMKYEERYIGVQLENPRFDKLAEVYGARGFHVTRPDEIADAVQKALSLDVPSVIEIPVAEYFPAPSPTPHPRSGH